jgi:hypothetical protein
MEENFFFERKKDLEWNILETVWIKLCPAKHPAHLTCFAYWCPQYNIPRG